MDGKYVIGIDGGTEGIRAGIFDLEGNPLAFAATSYKTDYPQSGWAEQNVDDWWQACGSSVKNAVNDAGISADDIVGLSIDTTCCSVVLLDADGNALRPALLWMDVRAVEQAEKIASSGDDALRVNSNGAGPVSAEWMIPKALWIKENEPEIYDAAAYICEYQDVINFRLTDRMCASVNNVSVRWHHHGENSGKNGAPVGLLDAVGARDLADKWPQDVLELGEVIGPLTESAADHLGLKAGTPVAQGGADAFIGMIGLGVVKPGAMAFITGSSHLQLGLSEKPFHGTGIWGTYSDAVIKGLQVVEGGQSSSGSIVNWFKNMFGEGVGYKTLDAEAAVLPIGADGLVVQDHFQGNRTPYTDPLSRGAITGLSLKHTRGHIFRAIMESVAFGSRLILDGMEDNGLNVTELVFSGGVTNSDLWLQIHADVCGKELILTKVSDAPALGSAILAAVGAGCFDTIEHAAEVMVHRSRIVKPNMENHREYEAIYQKYKALYPALKSV